MCISSNQDMFSLNVGRIEMQTPFVSAYVEFLILLKTTLFTSDQQLTYSELGYKDEIFYDKPFKLLAIDSVNECISKSEASRRVCRGC